MDILQEQNTLILLAGCCVGLFLFGGIIGFILQILGTGFSVIFTLIDAIFGVISGGPVAWCGCLVMIFGCAGCGVIVFAVTTVIPQCGTPQAVNLCRVLGY